MRKPVLSALVASTIALFACGGSVDQGDASTLPDCPANGTACRIGSTCRATVFSGCGLGSSQVTCACEGATWNCPKTDGCADAGPPIRETCGIAGAVVDGERCEPDEKGRSCKRFANGCIVDQTCTCDGAKFVCVGPPLSCDGGAPDAGFDAASDAPEGD